MGGVPDVDAQEIVRRCRAEWPRTSFLTRLDLPVLHDFLSAGELVIFGKGDVLLCEGDEANDVFLLLDACVKVTTRLDAGGQALLAIRVGGDVVGEIAVMDGGERTATVSVCGNEAVSAVRLSRGALQSVLERNPDAAVSLASAVSHKLRAATRRRVDITCCTAKVRLARVVLELVEDYGRPAVRGTLIGVNLTQTELGELVGIGETTAQRALRDLRENGLIVKAGRRLLIPDLAALRSAAWGESA
jgi:CRP/FNR family cyclic AMP-dependent transcriptional regulator